MKLSRKSQIPTLARLFVNPFCIIRVSPISEALDSAPKRQPIAAVLFRHSGSIQAHCHSFGFLGQMLHARIGLWEEVRMFHYSVP